MTPPRLVLFDGDCGLCNASVQFLLKHDAEGRLHYAPLGGETATAIRSRCETWPDDLDSIVFVEGDKILWRSRAVFQICAHLPQPWKTLRHLSLLPRWITDVGYRLIAAVRYPIWGRSESCTLPEPQTRYLFHP